MLNAQRLVTAFSLGMFCVGAMAQVAPICCRYIYSWPAPLQGPDGACSGNVAEVCEEGSPNASSGDPLAKVKRPVARYATCCIYLLGPTAYFIRSSCDAPPEPNTHLVGQLSDGLCCWVNWGNGAPEVDCSNRTFTVSTCENSCSNNVVPE